MKTFSLLLLCGAISCTALAQTETPPAPAATATSTPVASAPPTPKKVTPAPGSMPAKNPPTQPVPHTEKRALDNIAKAKAAGESIQLIFDGDSITDGWQGRGKAVWTERYAKYGAFDFGISGDTTDNVLWRLSQGQAEGLHPKLIVLMIGTNNMKYTSTAAEIAAGVKAILAEYQKRCPGAVILLQAIFPRAEMKDSPYRAKIKDTNAILATYADGKKVIYTDFGDKFLTSYGVLTQEIMPDFLHPSPKGYEIWADAIQPFIDKYMGK